MAIADAAKAAEEMPCKSMTSSRFFWRRVCIAVSLFYRNALTEGTLARSTAGHSKSSAAHLRMPPSPWKPLQTFRRPVVRRPIGEVGNAGSGGAIFTAGRLYPTRRRIARHLGTGRKFGFLRIV